MIKYNLLNVSADLMDGTWEWTHSSYIMKGLEMSEDEWNSTRAILRIMREKGILLQSSKGKCTVDHNCESPLVVSDRRNGQPVVALERVFK